MNIKIAIVDDNPFIISTIKEKLSFFKDLNYKFSARHGAELLIKLEDHAHVDIILMDLEMPVLNGIEATELVKAKYPHIKIIMLTVLEHDENIFSSIKAGADGYVLKETKAEDLHKSIVETLQGGAAMSPSMALKTLHLLRNPSHLESQALMEGIDLTAPEIEVLEQLGNGVQHNKIADDLIISPASVRKHIENIYKKLKVYSKIEAVQKAKQNYFT